MILTLTVCHVFRWGKTILNHMFLVERRDNEYVYFRQYMSDPKSAICRFNIENHKCYIKYGPIWFPLFYWSSVIMSYKIA